MRLADTEYRDAVDALDNNGVNQNPKPPNNTIYTGISPGITSLIGVAHGGTRMRREQDKLINAETGEERTITRLIPENEEDAATLKAMRAAGDTPPEMDLKGPGSEGAMKAVIEAREKGVNIVDDETGKLSEEGENILRKYGVIE